MMNFNEKYNHEDFLDFLNTFLPEDFQDKEEDILIKIERYKEITKAKILGFSESLDLHILEMDHARENDPRIAIATDAFKILADHWIHRALVIFKNQDSGNYRFSYLTISLNLNDKNKAVKKYSNARRYSFYLGANAKIRTPEQQLIKKGRVKNSEDLLSRFSVEVVNKQFYFEVARFFDELVSSEDQNLSLPSVSEENTNIRKSFAVRLIGRTMFCWFLKQKKSDNGQLIPDELLSSKVVFDNYYHNTLEPLFFGVLNTSIESRDIRNDLFDKVPYLNGGLFNPQSGDYYELDRMTFFSKYNNTLKISDSWFKRFFEVLETYNFTIDENTVFDQELSVDPEMLGRIFENLLAEINPETGSSERKRTGSFYTPRQIVEYMVDHSLIEYLKQKTKIDEKKLAALISYDAMDDKEYPLSDVEKQEIIYAVESLKILDPACGSGAFPIGALQKIVYILQRIDPDCRLWLEQKLKGVPELYKQKIINEVKANPFDYTRKLDIIKNSIFGVDIQSIAVDVSRLRCFLTLVVEAGVDDTRQNRGIEPLPNLDFKFVCANTLIPAPEQTTSDDASLFGDGFQEKLAVAVDRYFSSSGENKRSANNEIHKLIDNKVEDKLKHLSSLVSYDGNKKIESLLAKKNKKQISQHSRILAVWSSYKNIFENKPVDFFDPRYFFPGVKEGFDIVIGNPPYGAEIDDISLEVIKQSYRSKTQETAILFIERGRNLLKKSGVLSYILPKAYTFSSNYKIARSETRDSLLEIVDCGKAFENVKLEAVIIILSNLDNKNYYVSSYFDGSSIKQKAFVNKELLEVFGLFPNAVKGKELEIGLRIKNSTVQFSSISTNKRGEIMQKYLSETGDIAVVGGKEIDKFGIRGTKGYVDSSHVTEKAKIKSNSLLVQRMIAHVQNPRDHIKIIACIPDLNNEVIVDTINQVELNKTQYSKEYIWALLNSTLINWYTYNFILGKAIRTMQFDNPVSSRIPIVEINTKNQEKIESIEKIAKEIVSSKKQNRNADTQSLEFQIDELVMDLYGLNKEEKGIIGLS